ncbi:hypothetical protein BDP27DRAFT_1335311 [Rhodocollybia butyracea]|uniref:Uncharacterized protein n=1 Tax=Rhodocollybia butyracea TaxID=206335 RepID=A0A9P5PH75_9AGAR|nr:hypothetical protein BDP27DRAFT_1335311 [Rhodocollybia butyracea]
MLVRISLTKSSERRAINTLRKFKYSSCLLEPGITTTIAFFCLSFSFFLHTAFLKTSKVL